ncbi:MAG: hypothetical protein MJ070_11550, partial [Lachnospiraceae bacterium]|nr:hypothetical protein [Lachnospiraceae bacterium]
SLFATAAVSSRQLVHYSTIIPNCQAFFSSFFDFFEESNLRLLITLFQQYPAVFLCQNLSEEAKRD